MLVIRINFLYSRNKQSYQLTGDKTGENIKNQNGRKKWDKMLTSLKKFLQPWLVISVINSKRNKYTKPELGLSHFYYIEKSYRKVKQEIGLLKTMI